MILIADSGSTKTAWRGIDPDGNFHQYETPGINPYYQDEAAITTIFTALQPQVEGLVKTIWFYGAGCSTTSNKATIVRSFQRAFPEAEVMVNHDLLAAARSLCGRDKGFVCILGTGANSCFYDGEAITQHVPSVGYIMGDEGSGAWLGKTLLTDFIRKDMPQDIYDRLVKRFELSKEMILENIYQHPLPSRYLASFSRFIFQNIKEPYLYRLVHQGFTLFFEKNIEKYEGYKDYPVHFTGSVAFYYSNILRQVANDKGITVRNITEDPIAGLTLYHQS